MDKHSATFRPATTARFAPLATLFVTFLFASCQRTGPALSDPATARARLAPHVPYSSKYLSDRGVAWAVRTRLMLDGAVDERAVKVTVRDGVAELAGEQNNLLAKERATRLAELVRGVIAVSNQLVVNPVVRPPARVRADIEAALHQHAATADYHVRCTVRGGGRVTLAGTVHSWAESQLAERVAKSVIGVTHVDNDIAVEYPFTRSDNEIAADVRARLRWDAVVSAPLLNVAVDHGVVRLSGVVGTLAERRRAHADAWVDGVRSVDVSRVDITWWAAKPFARATRMQQLSDSDIEYAVLTALRVDPRVKVSEIAVKARHGRVTLTGSVAYVGAKIAAGQLARHTVGVSGVSNRLAVRWIAAHDRRIKKNVEAALRRHALVGAETINVSVESGVVTLDGHVAAPYQRRQAEVVAGQTLGVRRVDDELVIQAR